MEKKSIEVLVKITPGIHVKKYEKLIIMNADIMSLRQSNKNSKNIYEASAGLVRSWLMFAS